MYKKRVASTVVLPGVLDSFCTQIDLFSRTFSRIEIPGKIQALETLSVQINTSLAFVESAEMRDAYVDRILDVIAPIGRMFGGDEAVRDVGGCTTALNKLISQISLGILCCKLAQAMAASTKNPEDFGVMRQQSALWWELGQKAAYTDLKLSDVMVIWKNFSLAPRLVVSEGSDLGANCQTQQVSLAAQYRQILNKQLDTAFSSILGVGIHGETWLSQDAVLRDLAKQLPIDAADISDKNKKYLQILTTVLYPNDTHLLPDPVMQLQGVFAWGLRLEMTPLLPESAVSRGKSGTALDAEVERLPLRIQEGLKKFLKIVRDQIKSDAISTEVKARWQEAEKRIGDCVADLVNQTLTETQEKSVVSVLQQWDEEMRKTCSVGVDVRLIQLREDIAKACGQRMRQTWAPWAIERMAEILRGLGINLNWDNVHVVNLALLQVVADTAIEDPYLLDEDVTAKIVRQRATLKKLFFFTPVLMGADGFELDRVCIDGFVKRGEVRGINRALATETAMRELSLETVQTLGLEKTSDTLRCAAKSGRRNIFDWIATDIPSWQSRLFEDQPDGLSLMDGVLYGGITEVLAGVDQTTLQSGMRVYLPTTQNRQGFPNALGLAAESGVVAAVDFVVSHIPAEQLKEFATAHERKGGDTPLMRAVMSKNPEVVRRVLTLPGVVADINQKNNEGQTALIFAVESGVVPSVQILVERGSDPFVRVPTSRLSAIDLAVMHGTLAVLLVLTHRILGCQLSPYLVTLIQSRHCTGSGVLKIVDLALEKLGGALFSAVLDAAMDSGKLDAAGWHILLDKALKHLKGHVLARVFFAAVACNKLDCAGIMGLVERSLVVLSVPDCSLFLAAAIRSKKLDSGAVLAILSHALNNFHDYELSRVLVAVIQSEALEGSGVLRVVEHAIARLFGDSLRCVLDASIKSGKLPASGVVIAILYVSEPQRHKELLSGVSDGVIRQTLVSEFQTRYSFLTDKWGLDLIFRDVLKDDFFALMRQCFQYYNHPKKIHPNRHKLAQAIIDGTTDKVLFGACCVSASSVTSRLSVAFQSMGREPF